MTAARAEPALRLALRLTSSFAVALLLLATALYVSVKPVRNAVWASLYLADFVAGDGPSLFKTLTQEPLVRSDTITAASGVAVPFDLYSIRTDEPRPAIVFTHGMAREGNRDGRVQSQSRRLARAGFAVLAPDLQQMKHYALGFEDVDAVTGSLTFLHQHPDIDPTRIGIIAPSFGAGPVLIALSKPQIREWVRFGFVFGGYYDLRETLRYTLTGTYDAAGARLSIEPSNRLVRWKWLRGSRHLVTDSSSSQTFADFLSARIEDPALTDESVLHRLSDAERSLLDFTSNTDPAAFDSLYAATPATFRDWIDRLSLHNYTPDLRTRLIIVHSRADTKVPFPESLALSRHLPNAEEPFVAIVGGFTHVDLSLDWSSVSTIRNEIIPAFAQMWGLSYELLRHRP